LTLGLHQGTRLLCLGAAASQLPARHLASPRALKREGSGLTPSELTACATHSHVGLDELRGDNTTPVLEAGARRDAAHQRLHLDDGRPGGLGFRV